MPLRPSDYFPQETYMDSIAKAERVRAMRENRELAAAERAALRSAYMPDYVSAPETFTYSDARAAQMRQKTDLSRQQQSMLHMQELEGHRDMVGQLYEETGDLEAAQQAWDMGADELIKHGNPYGTMLRGMEYQGRHQVKMALPSAMTINGVTYPQGTVGIMYDAPGPDGVRIPQRFVPLKVPEAKRPYEVGEEVTRKEGENEVTYQVTGYDEQGMPVMKKLSTAPRRSGVTVNVGGKPAPASERKEITNLMALQKKTGRIRDVYDPSFVGPIAGRVGKAKTQYTEMGTEAQIKFQQMVRSLSDDLLRAKSGAQINEQEYKRMMSFLPSENDPPKTFTAKLAIFEDELETLIDTKRSALRQSGLADISGPATGGGAEAPAGGRPSLDDILYGGEQ